MTDNFEEELTLLERLESSARVVPRGWFRWLHNHYFGRYGLSHRELVYGDIFNEAWSQASDKPEPLYKREGGSAGQWVAMLNKHAWLAGMKLLVWTVVAYWHHLDSQARGAFIAGASEFRLTERQVLKLITQSTKLAFTSESACQLGCNSARYQGTAVLEALLQHHGDAISGTVSRFDVTSSPFPDGDDTLSQLSHRVIDMILEAALIWNNVEAARLVLQHGASPDIPVWQLERSYNQRYSALGYVIDSDFTGDDKRRMELINLLLDHGANPAGIEFAGKSHELFLTLSKGWNDLAERLIAGGASLTKQPDAGEVAPRSGAGGSEYLVIGPGPHFYGHFGDDLRWARDAIGSIIPLVSISEKYSFYSADGQGGQLSTFMDQVVGNMENLKRYEALGLDTRLSAEELCTAIKRNAYDSLVYLLSKHGDEAARRAMFRIRRRRPAIGTGQRYLELPPQEDGVNIAADFSPGANLEPFLLPDGSKVHVDLTAIAPPGHDLGPCHQGYFWLRSDNVVLRRRKDRVVVRRVEQIWRMEPMPLRPPGICREQRYLDACLPCVREVDGQFINLGMSLHGLRQWAPKGCELSSVSTPWEHLPAYVAILDSAEERINAQNTWNSRPPSPRLSTDELRGYPPEFWCHLVRMSDGFIGIPREGCTAGPYLIKSYRAWAKTAKKRERTFVPDPRLLEWEYWAETPPDFRPYLYIDSLANNRVSVVGADYYNRYAHAMTERVRNWLWDLQQQKKQIPR
ncbi:MAG: hypothetical protein AB7U43_00690 [Desulfobacter sp.]